MKALQISAYMIVLTAAAFSNASCAQAQNVSGSAQRSPFIGAWRLLWIETHSTNGKVTRRTDLQGMLVYTSDGHVSVQVMYPETEPPSKYAKDGYEASFGSYSVNARTHNLTNHLHGALVRPLIGLIEPLVYRLRNGRLTLRPMRTDEHWSATWQHY